MEKEDKPEATEVEEVEQDQQEVGETKDEAIQEPETAEDQPENEQNPEKQNLEADETKTPNAEENDDDEDDLGPPKDLEAAERLKKEGNEFFKQKKFEDAIEKYQESLPLIPNDQKVLKTKILSNLSICFKKLGDWTNTINYSSQALEVDPEFEKALVNRADAYYQSNNYEKGLEDYKLLKERKSQFANPGRLDICQQKVDEEFEKKKQQVFGQLKNLGNTILGKFGMSLDNFKLNPQQGGGYNISFQQ